MKDARRALLRALLDDDADAAHAILEAQHRAASGFDTVADEVIAPVLHEVGERWARGLVDVYEERRACTLVHRCLSLLEADLPPLGRGAARALGGTLEGDPFTIATALAELVLRERGLDARSLGAWLPATTIARAVRNEKPAVVWLSISHAPDPARLVDDVAEVEHASRAVGARLVVGGRSLDAPLRRRLRYSAFCDGMVQLAAFSDGLR